MYEIYNYKTGYQMGREFPTKKDADSFIKYLKSGTSVKLFWRARKVKTKNPSGTAVTVKSVGTNHNVYVGSTRVGSFPDKAEAVRYGKHLIKTRRLMSKRTK